MSFIVSILLGLGTKVGLDQAKKRGFLPQASYLKEAMEALKKDNLDKAVSLYRLAIERHKPTELSEAAAELIGSKIESHIAKFERRLEEINAVLRPKPLSKDFWKRALPKNWEENNELKREADSLREGIAVLHGLKKRLKD